MRRPLPRVDRARLVALTRRSQQVLIISGLTGAAIGLLVAGFDRLTADVLLDGVLDMPVAVQALIPATGLVVGVALLRLGGPNTTPATADEYIRAYHDPSRRLRERQVIARLLSSIATLGAGGPLGYEGPSVYVGASVGAGIQRRMSRFFGDAHPRVLLVAGAAAGVSAIFKAPVTGLVFALEVPYRDDLARRMLFPAAISSAASYVVFASIVGTEPILAVTQDAPFDLPDLAGAAVVGLVAGLFARAFVLVVRSAKDLQVKGHPAVRVGIAGAVLATTVLLGRVVSDAPLVLGPGYDAMRWALDPDRTVLAIVALATLRVIGTASVLGGGGTGGLFIPLVIQGALVGRAIDSFFDPTNPTLFPVVGMAAFLGAGYRVPLAAVVFVAEFTGRSGFVVPGLIAAVVAQLVVGRSSVSAYQAAGRIGLVEERLGLPLSTALDTEARTVPPDATVTELFWQHFVAGRQQAVPVVDGSRYIGMVLADDLAGVPRESWPTATVAEVMREDAPVASASWRLADAVRAMRIADVDRIAVCDDGDYVGVISAADLLQLDEILERTVDRRDASPSP